MRPTFIAFLLSAAVLGGGESVADTDWRHHGGTPDQLRYSPLTQITRENVRRLQVAWRYDTGDAFEGSEMQCQPVVAHGVLYATSPLDGGTQDLLEDERDAVFHNEEVLPPKGAQGQEVAVRAHVLEGLKA